MGGGARDQSSLLDDSDDFLFERGEDDEEDDEDEDEDEEVSRELDALVLPDLDALDLDERRGRGAFSLSSTSPVQ